MLGQPFLTCRCEGHVPVATGAGCSAEYHRVNSASAEGRRLPRCTDAELNRHRLRAALTIVRVVGSYPVLCQSARDYCISLHGSNAKQRADNARAPANKKSPASGCHDPHALLITTGVPSPATVSNARIILLSCIFSAAEPATRSTVSRLVGTKVSSRAARSV